MNNASANPSSSARTTTSVYKTVYGNFWHYEAVGRRRSSYVLTVCGRRLGRWHIEPAQPVAAIAAEDLCSGCLRKLISEKRRQPATEPTR